MALGSFLKHTRLALESMASQVIRRNCVKLFSPTWLSSLTNSRTITATSVTGTATGRTLRTPFNGLLPIKWDSCELSPFSDASGDYLSALDWVCRFIVHSLSACKAASAPRVINQSVQKCGGGDIDVIVTDPPYYDAIPYSDLMDFFYLWLRRTLHDTSPDYRQPFASALSPKWNHEEQDGELIDDASRYDGDTGKSKTAYEDGMFRAFQACHASLRPEGKLVVVFAHKEPDAWETLVSAIVRAGFVVDGSWPIQTEMGTRTRCASVSRPRFVGMARLQETSRDCPPRLGQQDPGRDAGKHRPSTPRLLGRRDSRARFRVGGHRPGYGSYSKHPVVKKANEPGQVMSVTEFLHHVRRIVVDFVVRAASCPAMAMKIWPRPTGSMM